MHWWLCFQDGVRNVRECSKEVKFISWFILCEVPRVDKTGDQSEDDSWPILRTTTTSRPWQVWARKTNRRGCKGRFFRVKFCGHSAGIVVSKQARFIRNGISWSSLLGLGLVIYRKFVHEEKHSCCAWLNMSWTSNGEGDSNKCAN